MNQDELKAAHPARREVFYVLWSWLVDELGQVNVPRFCGAHDMCDWINQSDGGYTIAVSKIKKLIKAYKQTAGEVAA